MALANTEQHGASYRWGFQSSDAPTITNFTPRMADLKFEPEVFDEAINGEGMAEGNAITLAGQRKITGSFTGYIATGFTSIDIANTFYFIVSGVNRFFVVKEISEPRPKGKYWEVVLTVQSNYLITS